jgi:hypothetical protein
MISELVMGTDVFASLQPVNGAAIGAFGLAGERHIQVHLRVAAPEFHSGCGAGAIHAALGVEVFGQQFNS